jgi:hypothetical protein
MAPATVRHRGRSATFLEDYFFIAPGGHDHHFRSIPPDLWGDAVHTGPLPRLRPEYLRINTQFFNNGINLPLS